MSDISNLHFAMNIPFHNFSFNPTDCRPVVNFSEDLTPKESISRRRVLLLEHS